MNSIEALKHALETLEEVQMAITTSQWMNRRIEELRAAILQAEKREPVAWMVVNGEGKIEQTSHYMPECERWLKYDATRRLVPLYTAPPQREWVGLTDEDIYAMIESNIPLRPTSLFEMAEWVAKIVEAKLKEKNA
jgi:predicted RecB family nuclease